MDSAATHSSDVAFTPSVKAVQARKGSRQAYARMEERGGWQTRITPDLAEFIAAQTSVFLATANAQGQPYIQHRGGPAGFLHVLDDKTIGLADFAGNRQYITQGNLADNPEGSAVSDRLCATSAASRSGARRVSLKATRELTKKLMPEGYKARPEHVILFTVAAWDSNCPQHIPQRFEAADVAAALTERDQRIAALEAEVKRLRETAGGAPSAM